MKNDYWGGIDWEYQDKNLSILIKAEKDNFAPPPLSSRSWEICNATLKRQSECYLFVCLLGMSMYLHAFSYVDLHMRFAKRLFTKLVRVAWRHFSWERTRGFEMIKIFCLPLLFYEINNWNLFFSFSVSLLLLSYLLFALILLDYVFFISFNLNISVFFPCLCSSF